MSMDLQSPVSHLHSILDLRLAVLPGVSCEVQALVDNTRSATTQPSPVIHEVMH